MAIFDIKNGVLHDVKNEGNEKIIEIPEEVKRIKKFPIHRNVKKLIIGPSVLEIDRNAFSEGNNLIEISIDNPNFVIKDECLFDKDQKVLYLAKRNIHKVLVLPESLEHIADYAFAFCTNFYSISINNNLKYLGAYAFMECENIYDIKLPTGHNYEIRESTFESCWSLKRIVIPSNITALGAQAFYDCEDLETVEIKTDKIKVIPYMCFANCVDLKRLDFHDGVEKIEEGAFLGCGNMTEITLPKTVKYLELEIFRDADNLTVFTSSAAVISYCEYNNIPCKKELDF